MSFRPWTAVLCLAASAIAEPAPAQDQEQHVVEIVVTFQKWDEDRPWAKANPEQRRAQAVVVGGPRLLVAAHLVAGATLIQVAKHGGATTATARIWHIDSDIDLALLEVEDDGFFDDLEPARLFRSVPTRGGVSPVRWAKRHLEVGSGRIARIEVRSNWYGHDQAFMMVSTDLASAGWSEPVFRGKWLIGLTMWEDTLAAVLPVDIIATYLRVARPGPEYPGFASLEVFWQWNNSRAVSDFLGLEGEPRGIIVTGVPWGSSGWNVLRPRDVVLELDGHRIDGDGFYEHPRYGRVKFSHIAVDGHVAGDRIEGRVLRDGEVIDVEMELLRGQASRALVPWRREHRPPPYLIAGGLVFRELDGEYLRTWSNWEHYAPTALRTRASLRRLGQRPERRRVVILASVLPDAFNMGYHDLHDLPVASANGSPIGSLRDLADALGQDVDGAHTIRFAPNDTRARVILDAGTLDAATERILRRYGIPRRRRLDEE